MQEIQNLAQIDYVLVILGLFAILFAVKKVIETFGYFKKKFRLKTGIDEDRETVENRIKTLEKHDNWQYQEIQKISKGIDDIKDNLVQKEISDIRWELLNFCSALTGGQDYNREAFEHIFRTYEQYEKILADNHMTNGYIVESMKAVREIYHNKLVSGDFR